MTHTEQQRIGKVGENIACMFLVKHGYTVLDRNYRKKFGEIDIVAKKTSKIYFIEVKSIAERKYNTSILTQNSVPHETKKGSYRPEENVHRIKQKRLSRAIQVYLEEKDVPHETEWQFDVITIRIDENRRVGKVVHIKDVIL